MGFMKNLKQLGRMAKRKKNKGNKQDPNTYQTLTDASGKEYKMDRATHAFHTMWKNKGMRRSGSGLNFFRGPSSNITASTTSPTRGFKMPGWFSNKNIT